MHIPRGNSSTAFFYSSTVTKWQILQHFIPKVILQHRLSSCATLLRQRLSSAELRGWGGERNEIQRGIVWLIMREARQPLTMDMMSLLLLARPFWASRFYDSSVHTTSNISPRGVLWYPVQCVCEAKPSQREESWDSLSSTLSWDTGSDTALVEGNNTNCPGEQGELKCSGFEKGEPGREGQREQGATSSVALTPECNSWEHSNTGCSRLFLEHSKRLLNTTCNQCAKHTPKPGQELGRGCQRCLQQQSSTSANRRKHQRNWCSTWPPTMPENPSLKTWSLTWKCCSLQVLMMAMEWNFFSPLRKFVWGKQFISWQTYHREMLQSLQESRAFQLQLQTNYGLI